MDVMHIYGWMGYIHVDLHVDVYELLNLMVS